MDNEIIKKEDKDIDFNNEIVEVKNKMIEQLKKGKDISPEVLALLNDSKQITIEFSKQVMDEYKKGNYQLMEQASGNLKAIMVDNNNRKHTVEIGNVKVNELFNVSPQEVVMQTMLFEVKQQLQVVIDDLNSIKNSIGDIHNEQLRARDSKCEAAIEAFNRFNLCTDKELKSAFLNTAIDKSISAYEELKNEATDENGLINSIKSKYNEEYGYWKVKDKNEFDELKDKVKRLKYVLIQMNKMTLLNALLYYNKKEDLLLDDLIEKHNKNLKNFSDNIRALYNCDDESISLEDNDWMKMIKYIPKSIEDGMNINLLGVDYD